MTTIDVAGDAESLSRSVADRFVHLTNDALRARGRCAVALSGGSTPKAVYQALAEEPVRSRVAWDQIDFFWGDERHVPPDHPDNNYRVAAETLLSKVPVDPAKVHRIRAEMPDAALAAQEYESDVRATFGDTHAIPRFDVILLGLGRDGHTASLFPGTPALEERSRLCVASWVATLGSHRITMTLPLINAARTVAFLVSGAEKAPIVRAILREKLNVPAQRVQPVDGDLWWLLDGPAAQELGEPR